MKNNTLKVVVTGGGNGIGRFITGIFAGKGASVLIADKDQAGSEETCRLYSEMAGTINYHLTDISEPDDIKGLFEKVLSLFGNIDILINNAGFGITKSADDLSVDEWNAVINTNLRGAFLCSREAARIMKNNNGGHIINIASTRALMSEPDTEAYAASKGGLVALTHAMAASYSKYNIRVNCISPGWIETGDYSKLRATDHQQHFSGRVGKPSDIANACIFLAENDFINGENIIIDGGMTRKMIYES